MMNVNLPRRKFLHLGAGVAALPTLLQIAWAQAYPSRPITIIVPFGPGSASDTIARVIAQRLGAALKQSIVVEAKPGAVVLAKSEQEPQPEPPPMPEREAAVEEELAGAH